MVRHFASAFFGLLLGLGAAQALAGRGDVDSSYGTNGRLTAATIFYDRPVSDLVATNLPDDRLVTVEEGMVRSFDSEGRIDLTFGENGETAFPLPAATPLFRLQFKPIATPDGGLLLAGLLREDLGTAHFEALIRLDRNGQLLTSFGGNGDGVYRLTTEPIPELCGGICTALMGVAVDPAGRVLLAKRSLNAQGQCSEAPRVDRLTPDGAIDSAFGTDGGTEVTGVDLCNGALAFGARGDESIVVAGGHGVISLDASGAREGTFGASGVLSLASSVTWSSAELLPDGGLLLAGSNDPPSEGGAVLALFDRLGQPDLLFGAGTGKLQLDLGASLFGMSGVKQAVSRMALDPDTGDLYLQVSMLRGNGSALCAGGIVRLAIDGTPDAGFGERGITCLDFGAFPFTLIGVQGNGAPLFGQLDGSIYRLLVDGSASPGFLTVSRSGVTQEVSERSGNATISVVRTAGQDGAVSAHFDTRQASPDPRSMPPSTTHVAKAGIDYRTASGRLEWADGDSGSQSTDVDILDDRDEETREVFLAFVNDPQGGAELYGDTRLIVGINDDDGAASPGDSTSGDSTSGGGGSTSWYAIAALAALAARARLRPRNAGRPD